MEGLRVTATDFIGRTLLYMPAANARALEKAPGLPADVVILDLEDSVAPDAKEAARAAAVAASHADNWGWRTLAIRVNGHGTPWHDADIDAVRGSGAAIAVVPKVDDAGTAAAVAAKLGGKGMYAMIETPRAVQRVDAIADAAGVTGLIAGFNDLARELRVDPGPERLPLLYAAMRMVNAARASGIAVFDGVYGNIRDDAGLAAEAAQGAALGFDGKTCIHPGQLAAVNRIFAPSPEAVAEAREVVAAFEQALEEGRGVATLSGRMIENLHADSARRLIERAEQLAARG